MTSRDAYKTHTNDAFVAFFFLIFSTTFNLFPFDSVDDIKWWNSFGNNNNENIFFRSLFLDLWQNARVNMCRFISHTLTHTLARSLPSILFRFHFYFHFHLASTKPQSESQIDKYNMCFDVVLTRREYIYMWMLIDCKLHMTPSPSSRFQLQSPTPSPTHVQTNKYVPVLSRALCDSNVRLHVYIFMLNHVHTIRRVNTSKFRNCNTSH